MIELTKYLACISEGAAEKAIIDLLFDSNKLIFSRDNLIEGEVLKCRNAKDFENQYLKKGFTEKITVFRILDSRRENFKLSKVYENKVKVVNAITAPDIEMLVVIKEKKYNVYKKSGKKPSEFCKADLGLKQVKTTDFVMKYFSNIDSLINSIIEYKRF